MELIYKILRHHEWMDAARKNTFAGSADDVRDGYLHFSSASQVRATFARYFGTERNTFLLSVEPGRLGPGLKWEESRSGARFPHFYGVLPLEIVHSIVEIRHDCDGRPIFPPEIP